MSTSHMVRASKRYGQHFLEPAWADKLVEAIGPRPDDRFLEIGPGQGALTVRLARRVAHVTAVELDPAMVASLGRRVPRNVTLVQGDFLEFDPRTIKDATDLRVAGNLPYNVAAPILFRLLAIHRTLRSLADATLMVQREVAARIEAPAGSRNHGLLAVFLQLHADVRRLLTLPPGAFRPVPKVHSAVVRFTFRPPAVGIADEPLFEQMVRSVFSQRRKMLVNALRPFAAACRVDAHEALASARIERTRRPETLQLSELARLADVLASARQKAVL